MLPEGSRAFAVVNLGDAMPQRVSIRLDHLGLESAAGYNVTEVFNGTFVGTFKPPNVIAIRVNPSGVFFGKATALPSS